MRRSRVAYVVRSWPRLSQTFVLNEVLALERLGCHLSIFALTRSGEDLVQPQLAEVRAPVTYLEDEPDDDGLAATIGPAPLRYLRAWVTVHGRRGIGAGYATATPAACLDMAARLARSIRAAEASGEAFDHLHAHFAHDPALVALFAHRLTGLPYSFTAHARDLYGVPPRALVARSRAATAIVTCCQPNADYLHETLPARVRTRIKLIHHGVDLSAFAPAVASAGRTPLIVSVGRLVEKKGFADLLSACARLHLRGERFRCVIYGDGPLRAELEAQRNELGLAGVVDFGGTCRQDEVATALRSGDIFALTPCVAADGDRDGVPNVLAEAMASGLPVVTTSVGGIEDLVRDGTNGLLARPHDVEAITALIGGLLRDHGRREQMGAAARRTVEDHFDQQTAAGQLADMFASVGR